MTPLEERNLTLSRVAELFRSVITFVQRLIATDPATALEWAQTIGNQNSRNTQVEAAVTAWMKTNPDDAASWVSQSSLPNEIKARLLPSAE